MSTFVLRDGFPLPLSPERAFPLFTARGEESWVPGWKPRFPTPTDDDTAPGTVFVTAHDTTWIVLDRLAGEHISYARVRPGHSAGTVSVALAPTTGGCTVEVTYAITALGDEGWADWTAIAGDYAGYLRSWQEAITDALSRPQP
ncbi:hypothetical protein Val02_76250 [Virgisporangium aliadipatigenens]|uniref:SRPBCC family protein n=1 Tax=Virgisporangium aliadipatigenens TaxID=741659 RepID=A0A8J4DUE4_9ACTN|nr:SRPBCC family protein [Virgisporangium aliadipatigenens]GIJ50739.1 hypothetical protein Val02_76250 [Virgisporangium aliadipatigenens]